MRRSLATPRLLSVITRLIARWPWLFNLLLTVAQSEGVIMQDARSDLPPHPVQSPADLSEPARLIYNQLCAAIHTDSDTR
jgi:hypothetical protein